MIQNLIGELESTPKRRKVNLYSFEEGIERLKVTLPQLGIILALIGLGIFTELDGMTRWIAMGTCAFLTVFQLYFIFSQYRNKANEPALQQTKYYKWGQVEPSTDRQLEALQLIAFARFANGFWTDTIEASMIERRVKHVPKFREKLNWYDIDTQDAEIAHWVKSWGMSSRAKYDKIYKDLLNGLHTKDFALVYNQDPAWKNRLADMTDLPQNYIQACFSERTDGRPKKLTWAWDLWRSITVSAAAFECGFVTEQEAWDNMYQSTDLSHYLFDSLQDYYDNIRLGHAFWCNDDQMAYDRKVQIEKFLNPEPGARRRVHDAKWTQPDHVDMSDNMKNSCAKYMADMIGEEITDEPRRRIGFFSHGNEEE